MPAGHKLTEKKCEPCEGKTAPFTKDQAKQYLPQVAGWQLSDDGKMISKQYITKNFLAAVNFIRNIANVAEAENHHPDLHLTGYRKLKADLSTHALGGLSENDFIVAAKINQIPVELKS